MNFHSFKFIPLSFIIMRKFWIKKIQFTYWKSAVDATHRIPLNSKQKKAEWTNAARGACVHLSERVLKCAAWNTSLIYWIPWNLWIDCSQVDPLNSHSILLCLHPSCMHSIDRLCAERECVYPLLSSPSPSSSRQYFSINSVFIAWRAPPHLFIVNNKIFSHQFIRAILPFPMAAHTCKIFACLCISIEFVSLFSLPCLAHQILLSSFFNPSIIIMKETTTTATRWWWWWWFE